MTTLVAFPLASSFLIALLLAWAVPVRGNSETNTKRTPGFNEASPLDRPLFAIQIGSIAAAYVIFVAILLALLLVVGRRLRRTVHSSNYSLQMEMMKPAKFVSIDPSPVSPMSQDLHSPSKSSGFTNSWGSLAKGGGPSQPSINGSMTTVDEAVVASDRQRAQDQMEMLYAAVMEHDAQKSTGFNVAAKEQDYQAQSRDSQYTNPFTDRASRVSEGSTMGPLKSPKMFHSSRLSKLFSSNTRSSPDQGKLRSPRLPVRKLPISSPLASPDMATPHSYGHDQPPMSPRIYHPGPPPATPNTRVPVAPQTMQPPGRARPPAPLNLAPPTQPTSNLPFREAYPLQSAPATKTTILERPEKQRNGPITGMPTPYSAYMPFTPVTPFTPGRMVNKRQRKREEREKGLRVLNEDDMVKDESEIWG
ncbi:hypothetical protein NUU61_009302 [Penicillium alfredii]|uniref:Uncharacterized protein n=1 Tax=Penicillium alfredii TaxID=1506179 RepID=A0A9W9EMU5_9EURO|nr:uncharacterized protein NUU61_009302 [Penicillium alfredii]KAJ5084723.1 hypothetical protein NUU61_009302 [Penicillium alfredii]